MSDIHKRLNKILEKVFSYGVGTNSEDIIGNDTAFLNIKEHALETGKQAIKQLMIDEFEKLIGKPDSDGYEHAIKLELRQKLKEWNK